MAVWKLFPLQQAMNGVEVWAKSGSAQDIQNAVNEVAAGGGGVVYVPDGTYYWNNSDDQVSVPAGVSIIGMGKDKTILERTTTPPWATMFVFTGTGDPSKPSRFSGITLRGYERIENDDVEGEALRFIDVFNFRVDHCDIINFPQRGVAVRGTNGCRGVVDHCNFKALYKDVYGGSWFYGVGVGTNNYWDWDDDITHFLGKYEDVPKLFPVVYVEDCYFYKTRHAIASNQLGWYVFRYNKVYQTSNSGVDVHGSTEIAAGGRGGEVYNNNIRAPIGVGFRGGSGVIYNNNEYASPIAIMKDIEGTPLRPIKDLWIWNNKGEFTSDGYYVENRDYFLRPPSLELDGFEYKPYPYPHPLVTGVISPYLTPWSGELDEGTYKISMPQQFQVGIDVYNFKRWEDGSTNPVRTINLTADTTITATYEKVVAPPTPIPPPTIVGPLGLWRFPILTRIREFIRRILGR